MAQWVKYVIPIWVLGIGISNFSFGWGHTKALNDGWRQATLTQATVQRGKITYCVNSSDHQRFPPYLISKQVRKAVRVWLSITSYYAIPILERDCGQEVDLLVVLDREKKYPKLSAYELPQREGERFYSYIKINSDFTYRENNQQYQVQDFAHVLPTPMRLPKAISSVSYTDKLDVEAAAQKYGIHYQKLYLSTYKMLLHEIGHSFGLCDTSQALRSDCDPHFRSSIHAPAVMNGADYFYLTDDDKTGIAEIFRRYEAGIR